MTLAQNLFSKAAVLTDFGKTVSIQSFNVPEPPKGGMVVDIQYAGVCGTDLHLQKGHLDIPTPLILGHEGLGRVHSLSPELKSDSKGVPLIPGDSIMWASSISCGVCEPCATYKEPTLCMKRQTYGVNRPTTVEPALSGAWAEYIALREGTTVIKLPASIDPVGAMALACAGPTMVHAIEERRPIKKDEIVIVQGSGPVGLAAAALAKLGGASRVIIIGGPAERLKIAEACGFGDEHIDVTKIGVEAAIAEALAYTFNGDGADLVIECAGVPDAIGQGFQLARRGGSYLIVGQYSNSGDTTLNPHQIVYRQLDIIGSWAFGGKHVIRYVELLPELAQHFDLKSLVTLFSIDDVNEAMHQVEAGAVMKAVLDCRTK